LRQQYSVVGFLKLDVDPEDAMRELRSVQIVDVAEDVALKLQTQRVSAASRT